MLGYIVLGVALLLPLALGVGFRVGTSHIFFSLMAGELLGRYFGHDLDKLIPSASPGTYEGLGEAFFILVPMIVTAYIIRGDITRKRLVIHTVPLLVTGIICAAFLLPVLPDALQAAVRTVQAGGTLIDMHRAIVGGMVALQLGWLWMVHRKRRHGRGGEL